MICWQCHETIGAPVCVGCGALQPPPGTADPYVILGLKPSFSISDEVIDDAWRARSRMVHPDRWAGKSAVVRRMSLQWTAAVNSAKRVLKDPLARARFLSTGDPNPPETGGPQPDGDFLEVIFDLQMMAHSDPDGAKMTVAALWDKNRTELDATFHTWETGEGTLDAVGMTLAKLQYLNTARTQTGA